MENKLFFLLKFQTPFTGLVCTEYEVEAEKDKMKEEDEAFGHRFPHIGSMGLHPLSDIWFSSEKAGRRGSQLAGLIRYSAV